MEIRVVFSFCLSLFIILNVTELNAENSQQKNVVRVCGRPAKSLIPTIPNKVLFYDESPWMVALLNKLKIPAEFFCSGTLISTRHVITGKKQMQNQIFSSFGDKERL